MCSNTEAGTAKGQKVRAQRDPITGTSAGKVMAVAVATCSVTGTGTMGTGSTIGDAADSAQVAESETTVWVAMVQPQSDAAQ